MLNKMLTMGVLLACLCAASAADVVTASSFGWNAADSTESLQAALDSGARTVIVDRAAGDWIVRPLFVRRSDFELVFADGVVVRAKKDAFHKISDSLLTVGRVTNVVIRGEGKVRLEMNKADYLDRSRYEFSEWRMGLLIGAGSRNITVRNLEIVASGGDGVYVNGARDVTLEDLICRDHNRQGISIIQVSGLTVRRCRFETTDGAPPMAGLDIEPNNAQNYCENTLFEDCAFVNNKASGVIFCFPNFTSASRPVSVTLRNCEIRGNAYCGISFLGTKNDAVRGMVTLEGCRIAGNAASPLSIRSQVGAIRLKLRDCVLDARGCAQPALWLDNGGLTNDLSNISFERVKVLVDKGPAYVFKGMSGVGLTDLEGRLEITDGRGRQTTLTAAELMARHRPQPELKVFQTRDPEFEKLAPVVPFARLPKPVATPYLRYQQTFVQYVPQAGEYPIKMRFRPVRKNTVRASVRVFTPGADIESFALEGVCETNYVIRAVKSNVFLFDIEVSYGGWSSVESPWPGCGTLASRGINLQGRPTPFYFSVPEGARALQVRFSPTAGEPASIRVLDPSGRAVVERPYLDTGAILRTPADSVLAAGLWQLDFPKVHDDCAVSLGGDALTVVSFSPETALTVGK